MSEYIREITVSEIDQIMLDSIEEILGAQEAQSIKDCFVNTLLNNEDFSEESRSEMHMLQEILEDCYGQRSGWGLAQLAGQSSFNNLLRRYGNEMEICNNDFRFLPIQQRLFFGLQYLAKLLEKMGGVSVRLFNEEKQWVWESIPGNALTKKESQDSTCHFLLGLLHEYFSWASGGKFFEIRCNEGVAFGGQTCRVEIAKHSLD